MAVAFVTEVFEDTVGDFVAEFDVRTFDGLVEDTVVGCLNETFEDNAEDVVAKFKTAAFDELVEDDVVGFVIKAFVETEDTDGFEMVCRTFSLY